MIEFTNLGVLCENEKLSYKKDLTFVKITGRSTEEVRAEILDNIDLIAGYLAQLCFVSKYDIVSPYWWNNNNFVRRMETMVEFGEVAKKVKEELPPLVEDISSETKVHYKELYECTTCILDSGIFCVEIC